MTIYQISGLGAGVEVFSTISLSCKTVFIPWLQPHKKESLKDYSKRMATTIDTEEEFCLMGVSFGGIVCQEIAKIVNPKTIFLISSVTQSSEVPFIMKLPAKLGLNSLIPQKGIERSKEITHFLFGAKRKSEKQFLNNILDKIDIEYLKWSTAQIGLWNQKSRLNNTVRFHGKKDFLFPRMFQKRVDYWLENGHFASVQEGKKISVIVNEIIQEC
ncbi:MAG: alpha/beta hydrolase [Salibacteraceae bacterium]